MPVAAAIFGGRVLVVDAIVPQDVIRQVRIWDAATRKERKVLEGHTDLVLAVAVSPDGKRVLFVAEKRAARRSTCTMFRRIAWSSGPAITRNSPVFAARSQANRLREGCMRVSA